MVSERGRLFSGSFCRADLGGDQGEVQKGRKVTMTISNSEEISTHLDVLCQKIGVRLTGTSEEVAAGHYAAEKFREYGAVVSIETFPVGCRKVRTQQLEVKINEKWIHFPCSLLGSSPGTDGNTISAPLVYFESEVDYQRKDLSFLSGKAVVHMGTHIESRECYRRLMDAHPAFLLFVDLRFPGVIPTSDGLFPAYVSEIGARPTVSAAYFDAWKWAETHASEARLTVDGETVSGTGINVIADFPGTDPDAGILYTGSHLDTQADTVGADDNASGMAWQLELARILASRKWKRTIRHIAFGAEEQLSVGSAAYVRSHRDEIAKHGILIFNADSCGSLLGWTRLNFNGPEEIGILLKTHFERRNLYSGISSEVIPYSDQFPFAACGIPGVWLERPNCTNGHFYHHRPENTADKISPEVLAKYVEAAAAFLGELADAEPLPYRLMIPPAQLRPIESYWQDLFGGW